MGDVLVLGACRAWLSVMDVVVTDDEGEFGLVVNAVICACTCREKNARMVQLELLMMVFDYSSRT